MNVSAMNQLAEICGYTADSSEQVVVISQDDATRSFIITVKGYGLDADATRRTYHGKSLLEAIEATYNGERGRAK